MTCKECQGSGWVDPTNRDVCWNCGGTGLVSVASELIIAERVRQVRAEDWDESHDDNHIFGELAKAAACYAFPPEIGTRTEHWPWDFGFWKPTPDDRIRELVKAGALIVAEIERLQRLQG